MTVAKLIKELQKLNPRAQVCFDENSINRQYTWNCHAIKSIEQEFVQLDDGDGYPQLRANGTPKEKLMVILKAGAL